MRLIDTHAIDCLQGRVEFPGKPITPTVILLNDPREMGP